MNKKDMQDGIWKKCITLREETDFKNFSVKMLDKVGKPLSGDTCDIQLWDIAEKIADIPVGKDGTLSYKFDCKADASVAIILHNGGNLYTQNIDIHTVLDTVQINFQEVLSQETIETKLSGNAIGQFTDKLSDDERKKSYTVSPGQAGPYWIEFNHPNLTTDSSAWKVYLMDNNGNKYMEFYSNKNRENTSSPIVGLQPGDYIIYVESYSSFSDEEYQMNRATSFTSFIKKVTQYALVSCQHLECPLQRWMTMLKWAYKKNCENIITEQFLQEDTAWNFSHCP